MSVWIDRKYASIFGNTYLEKYTVKKTSPYLANFRCPVCGDSQSNKNKTRGYFYEIDNKLNAKCHNCGWSTTFSSAIRQFAPNLYEEYSLENFREKQDSPLISSYEPDISKTPLKRIDKFEPFKNLQKVSQLPHDHYAKKYIVQRCIPSKEHFRLYYTKAFYKWANSIVPDKFPEYSIKNDEARIVLPFINEEGYVFGFSGRSINKNTSLRYVTVIFNETENKIFGLDRIDRSKDIIVVEGQFDALFIDNAVALAGSDGNLDYIAKKKDMVLVLDNQPRNRELVYKLGHLVYNDYRVVIWPNTFPYKDINEAVMDGIEPLMIEKMIRNNTVSGLEAQIRFSNWKKI